MTCENKVCLEVDKSHVIEGVSVHSFNDEKCLTTIIYKVERCANAEKSVTLTLRLRAVPIFPLEFVEPQKDIANASVRKTRQGKTREARTNLLF